MDTSLFQVLKSWIALSWDFFTEITIPGTSFTFAAFFVGLFLADLGLRFLFMVLGMTIDSGSFSLFGDQYKQRQELVNSISWRNYLSRSKERPHSLKTGK